MKVSVATCILFLSGSVNAFTTQSGNSISQSSLSRKTQIQPTTQNIKNERLQSFILLAVPVLEEWSITPRGEVSGIVKNHPDLDILDGEFLTTSKLATVADKARQGSTVVTASGSKYKLGKPKNMPQAKKPAQSGGFSFFGGKKSTLAANKKMPILDNWTVTVRGECKGKVSNYPDPSIEDGEIITTSKINEDRGSLKEGSVVTTSSGSSYILGKKRPGLNPFSGSTTSSAASRGGTFNVAESTNSLGSPSPKKVSAPSPWSSFSVANKPSAPAPSPTGTAASNSVKAEAARIQNLRDLKLQYGVNGKTVGNGKYLLAGKPQRSTSGKSNIWSGYRADKDGLPTGDKLTVKVSTNFDAISREADNYNRVCSGLFPGRFVDKAEFLPNTNGDPANEFKNSCALIIESGRKDLKAILAERGGRGFEGRAMRDAASAALQCIQAMHSSGIVWTDMKSENFVIVSDEIGDNGNLPGVKGIDLESAIPRGANPVDFSPEACPPEFANAFISGEGLSFKLDYSYDIWSYGMMLYELTTGRSYFGNKTPAQITKSLQYSNFKADVSAVSDSRLRDLISLCLQPDPKKRPGVTQLLLHPYFLTSGVGPFGW
ncbi:hypothetical protein CTEN210_17895 [Chaetoceros tenuissimus]|uniref:Protein kinase domain-containing protein n=1 Tax=Chaetoceros tenuissimus TaxID=426638 RepID=A0AAD3DBI6_9STRA|nr:hypothetical protein CTEN210_17895 [Chaetoceros tenuissimus]